MSTDQKPAAWPREFWLDYCTPYGDPCDFIHTEDPHETAKKNGTHPCISATNIHVIEFSAYQSLAEELEQARKERDELLAAAWAKAWS